MKRLRLILFTVLGLMLFMTTGQCAWDASKPTDTQKLKDTPALIRANNDAIALGTDAALLVTNAKVSPTAAIVDTKLATISTAGKVSGAAITLLPNVPAGAGALPIANGGTGQIAKEDALNALLPTQTGNSGKSLVTNGTTHSWGQSGVVLPSGAVFYMITGSCPTGTTDVTATYSNKYVKINATQGTSSGTVLTGTSGSHTLITSEMPAHTHSFATRDNTVAAYQSYVSRISSDSPGTGATNSTGGGGGHTHTLSSATTLEPSSITCKMCQVN